MKKLLILSMSGGLDSSTLCARALKEGYTVLPVNYIYGQKNEIETKAQEYIFNHLIKLYPNTLLNTITVNLTSVIGDTIKTWQNNRDSGEIQKKTNMEYYMPSRNLMFMVISNCIGEIVALDSNIESISLGLGIHKHSDIYARDYWDISPEFAYRLQNLLLLNDNMKVEIYAPYADKYKSEIIEDSIKYYIPYELTWTCYAPVLVNEDDKSASVKIYKPCCECEACRERESQAETTSLVGIINDYIFEI